MRHLFPLTCHAQTTLIVSRSDFIPTLSMSQYASDYLSLGHASDRDLQTGYPGVPNPTGTINMINDFLDWAQQQSNGLWQLT